MAEALSVKKMFSEIAPRYDLANTVLSFGIHHLWRRQLVSMLPKSDDKLVLDLCTGTGDLIPLLAKRFGEVIGADFCQPMLEIAAKKTSKVKPKALVQADALNLPFPEGNFNIVSVAFGVRNFENLERGLREIYRVLKPGGSILVLEFGQPQGAVFGTLYRTYSRYVMPVVGGLLSGNKKAYEYLPETANSFPCGEKFLEILKDCGFKDPSHKSLTGGIAYAYKASKE